MSLSPPTGGLCSGAAFNLGKPARASEVVDVDGWTVEVRAGQPVIVARGGDEATYAGAVQAGLGRAQKALDLMCMRRTNNLATKDVEDEHLTWWASSEGLTVRAVSIATVGTDIPPVTLEVVDAAGNVRPQPPRSQAVWHESFRYFRLSQTTDDLFDAYRNAYLALESVLSSVAPQKLKPTGQPAESESDWFKRALAAAGKLVDLATHAPPDTPDPELRLFEELFRYAFGHVACQVWSASAAAAG